MQKARLVVVDPGQVLTTEASAAHAAHRHDMSPKLRQLGRGTGAGHEASEASSSGTTKSEKEAGAGRLKHLALPAPVARCYPSTIRKGKQPRNGPTPRSV